MIRSTVDGGCTVVCVCQDPRVGSDAFFLVPP